ncbi:O-antigen ligase [Psychrobacillus sp. OK028]|uniref:O-antigen ligase family protein n=1 Tax=Psychrobacillus sp. OK028 TaxID=1884359 RepID=UPI0008906A49|nr:O-antigen ligase family protein [Psychrobacillus sp. OK028]SDM42382.1 O-antigen ligase [Psychrobacillus sp. OK028]
MKQSSISSVWKIVLLGALLLLIALLFPQPITAYAITLILGVISIVKPKESLFLLIYYFPIRSFLVEINPSLKLIGDIIIIGAFVRVVWDARSNWKQIFRFEIFEWAFIAFLIIGAISSFITGVSTGAIVFQLRAFAITFLLLYVVKRLSITKSDIITFLWNTLIVALIIVVQGLVEKLSMRSALMPETWINRSLSSNNRVRIYGLLNNPNVLATFLTIATILTVYLKKFVTNNKLQWFLNISLILMVGVWILTYSRGTWIAVVIGIVVYTLLTRKWKVPVKAILLVGISFLIVTMPTTYISKWINNNTEIGNFPRTGPAEEVDTGFADESKRLEETFSKSTFDKSKTTGRLFVVYKGFEVYKDYPLIGSGFGTFGDSASKSYSSPIYKDYDIETNIYADNQYIEVIAQNGTVGVILFAVFLLGLLHLFWKHRKTNPYAIPLLASLVGIYWCGVIYNMWEDKTFTMYFFIITAVFIQFVSKKERISK